MRRGPLAVVCLALLVVLAGCAGAGGGSNAADGGADVAASGETGAAADAESTPSDASSGGDDGSGGVNAQIQNRAIIYEATVELRVENFSTARSSLVALANDRGGYVGSTTQQVRGEGNQTWTEGRIVLRVPSGNYSGAVEAVRGTGEVRSFDESTRDVTNQVVDLEARLESLRAERDRLRELYDEANDTEDVLAVQRELSDVQTEIERTEAQLQNLERQVAYSTIVVELREPRPDYEPPEQSQWYDTPVTEAFLESVNGVIVLGRGLIVVTAYALPYLAVLAVPALGGVLGFRYLRDRP